MAKPTPDAHSGAVPQSETMYEIKAIADWIRLIRGEYLESPGLQLTEAQARRLWGLDPDLCGVLLETLVDIKFLKESGGIYSRADDG